MKTFSFGDIVYKTEKLDSQIAMSIDDEGNRKILTYKNLPIKVEIFGAPTLEEKCKIVREFLEKAARNSDDNNWNDEFDFNEVKFYHMWVEITV